MKPLRFAAAVFVLASPALAQFEGVLQMKMTSPQASGTTTSWISRDGMKTEVDMKSPDMQKAGMGPGMKMVTIVKFPEPDLIYMINDSAKTYSVMDTKAVRQNARGQNASGETYTVKRLGSDTVAGFQCSKAIVTSSDGTRIEICSSTNFMGGEALMRSLQRRSADGGGALMKALVDAGLAGYPVRWVTKSKDGHGDVTVELVSATKQSVPASTFEVPAGYTKSDSAIPYSNPEIDKKMKEALDKMTPEQRKQFEEMMKKRSGGS